MWIYRRMMKISWKQIKTNIGISQMAGRNQTVLVRVRKEKASTLATLKGTKVS